MSANRPVILYGPLLRETRRESVLRGDGGSPLRVRVSGFAQAVIQRSQANPDSGYITATPDHNEWFPALLIPGVGTKGREAVGATYPGYSLVGVDQQFLDVYENERPFRPSLDGAVMPLGYDVSDAIEPEPAHLTETLRGALEVGNQFAADFCTTLKTPSDAVEPFVRRQ